MSSQEAPTNISLEMTLSMEITRLQNFMSASDMVALVCQLECLQLDTTYNWQKLIDDEWWQDVKPSQIYVGPFPPLHVLVSDSGEHHLSKKRPNSQWSCQKPNGTMSARQFPFCFGSSSVCQLTWTQKVAWPCMKRHRDQIELQVCACPDPAPCAPGLPHFKLGQSRFPKTIFVYCWVNSN